MTRSQTELHLTEVRGPLRLVYWGGATFFFSLAMVGVVLPGVPTTPFLMLMCYFLIRVSPSLHEKAMRWPVFGEPLRVWHRQRGVRTRVKCLAVALVGTFVIGNMLLFPSLPGGIKLTILLAALYGIYVVIRLPTAGVDRVEARPHGRHGRRSRSRVRT